MHWLIAILLVPIGFAASVLRPFLAFFGFALLFSGGFAYLNPGLVDPAWALKYFAIGGACWFGRYVCDLIQSVVHRNVG